MTITPQHPQLDALLSAYCQRVAALNRMAAGTITVAELLIAERNLWAQLLSSPYGHVAVGLFGGAFVSFADTVQKLPEMTADDGKIQMGGSSVVVEDAAAQVAIRVAPELNATTIRMRVAGAIAELSLVKSGEVT